MNKVPDTRWTRRVSWNTVRPGMSVFSKNTGPYRMISAPQYALFHTVVDLEALPSTQDVKCDDVGNWRNNSNEKLYFSVEWMDDNSAQVTERGRATQMWQH